METNTEEQNKNNNRELNDLNIDIKEIIKKLNVKLYFEWIIYLYHIEKMRFYRLVFFIISIINFRIIFSFFCIIIKLFLIFFAYFIFSKQILSFSIPYFW